MAANNQDKVKTTFSAQQDYDNMWNHVFNQLCYRVFEANSDGKQLLAHLENKYFRRPVAIPGKDSSWSYFNEGFNECIRSFTKGIQSHSKQMRPPEKPVTNLKVKV